MNIPAKSTTVEFAKPLYTEFIGINPKMPQAIAALIDVIASGIISVTNNKITMHNKIRHLIAGVIASPL